MSYMNKLAFSLTVILRIYSQDDFFEKIYIPSAGFGIIHPLKEVQVGLVFARDYDEHGKHTNGLFKPYWDERKVTPQLISDFKQNYSSRGVKAKVFATIGGRSTQYPFQIKGGEGIDAWVSNAAESLTSIVKKYNLDGIDVYYEHINAKQDDFVGAIGQLIEKLKKENVITEASIAPSADVNQNFYVPLSKKHGKSIGTVVYQCHNEVEPVPDPQTLFDRFQTEAVQNYGRENLLAGYSAIYKDWNTVLPIVYFLGGAKILGVGSVPDLLNPFAYSAVGTSIWVVFPNESLVASPSVTSVTPNFPKWMLDASTRKIMAY